MATTTVSALNAPSSPTTLPTSTTVSVPSHIDNANLRITFQSTSLFTITCGQDFGGFVDIIAIVTYLLQDCARACASYNLNWEGIICKGATFNSDLGGSVARNFVTGFLKNGTGSPSFSANEGYAELVLQ